MDDWRLMLVNREAIDQGAEALVKQRELVGAEIEGLLSSIGLRMPDADDPYPKDAELVPPMSWDEGARRDGGLQREVPRTA
jgi:hypothetical protein